MSNIEFTSTTKQLQGGSVKCLVYGQSGMGKTMLCATAPTPIIISNESGLLSLSKANLEKVYGVANPTITYDVPVIKISNMAGLVEAYRWCTGSAEAKMFQTFCLDSLSEMGESILNNAKKTVKDPRQAYGELITQTEDMVRAFRDIPEKSIYMSAKLEPVKDEFTGIVKYGISMPGAKLGNKLPYFFDECFALRIGQDQAGAKYRYLQTQPDMQHDCKDRSGLLDAMEYPHLGQLFNKITGVSK